MSPTILVIDDHPKIQESFCLAFPEYQFVSAYSGEDGLKLLKKANEIDLVILDYKMGGLNGIQVLKEIRCMDDKMGVILMTSFGSKEIAIEALRANADDFVDKPYSVDEMRKKLDQYFENHEQPKNFPGVQNDSMRRAMGFVQRNYGKNPTLEELADKVSLSAKYVSRKFKKETSQTFSDYKIGIKMEQAKKFLSQTSLGIAQIAYKVGYENAESFMKAFKKNSGCTPTEYRQRENGR